jgi:DNA ligase-associated metallophosphoesterase
MELTFANEQFVLLADRAMLWPRRKMLIVADTHFGKDALFQARGIPVPNDVTSNDLQRLSALIELTESKELLILGDFFHGKESNDAEMTKALHGWRSKHSGVTMMIVRGNHDKHAGDPCDSLCIDCLNSLRFDSIKFQHAPANLEGAAPAAPVRGVAADSIATRSKNAAVNRDAALQEQRPPIEDSNPASDFDADDDHIICGHIHPATTLVDFDGTAMKVPCFVVDPNQMILPAFGRFTGTCTMERVKGREFFIASHGRVLRAPAR